MSPFSSGGIASAGLSSESRARPSPRNASAKLSSNLVAREKCLIASGTAPAAAPVRRGQTRRRRWWDRSPTPLSNSRRASSSVLGVGGLRKNQAPDAVVNARQSADCFSRIVRYSCAASSHRSCSLQGLRVQLVYLIGVRVLEQQGLRSAKRQVGVGVDRQVKDIRIVLEILVQGFDQRRRVAHLMERHRAAYAACTQTSLQSQVRSARRTLLRAVAGLAGHFPVSNELGSGCQIRLRRRRRCLSRTARRYAEQSTGPIKHGLPTAKPGIAS